MVHDATRRSRWTAAIGVVALVALGCARSSPPPAPSYGGPVVPAPRGGGPPPGEAAQPLEAPPPTTTPEDAALGREVSAAITDDPVAAPAEVILSVENGVVRLEGTTPDFGTHAAVLSAVWGVPGVRGVVDRLATSTLASPSNLDVALGVRDALVADPRTRDLRLEVAVEGGLVRLTGVVPSLALRERAEVLARDVRGVREVVNALRVVPPQ